MARPTLYALSGTFTLLALGACKVEDVYLVPPPTDGGQAEIPGLLSLSIDPPSSVIVDDGLLPAEERSFRAIGHFADGDRDVSLEVTWSVTPVGLGSIQSGRFSSAGIGGRGAIEAVSGTLSAQADLEVRLDAVEAGEGIEPGDIALFPSDTSSDTVDAAALDFRYPSHEVTLPQNLAGFRFEWTASPSLDRFEIVARSPLARIRYFSLGNTMSLSASAWSRLAATHAGADVEIELRGVSRAAPGRIYAAPPITVSFSQAEIPGGLYYWSSTTQALMRARLDAPLATRALPTTPGKCVGCHGLSRDGRKVAYSEDGKLRIASLPDLGSVGPASGAGPSYEAAAFSPDGTKLLVAERGRLELYDGTTGASLGPVTLPADHKATQPDWSPDGRYVAVTYLPGRVEDGKISAETVRATSIAILPIDGNGGFGPAEILVRSQGEDDTNLAPSVSPDGSTIAYVKVRGRSKDNRRAEIFLIRADGGGGPVSLSRLNRRGGGHLSINEVGNNFPVWAPSSRPGVSWLAFGSGRDVGRAATAGHDQLWAAAIDLARVVPGDDPSRAAFWLPFQRFEEANHRPQWTPDPQDGCGSSVDICGNGLDDDCSGSADDACCTPGTEACGNVIDDDCDGVVDEGCGCALTENCANTLDDDCDGFVDGDDSDCDD